MTSGRGRQVPAGGAGLGAARRVRRRDVRFGRAGTVSFESLPSEFCQKFSKFCSHFWNRSGKTPAKTGFTKKPPWAGFLENHSARILSEFVRNPEMC